MLSLVSLGSSEPWRTLQNALRMSALSSHCSQKAVWPGRRDKTIPYLKSKKSWFK